MRTSITLLVAAVLLFPLTANATEIPGPYVSGNWYASGNPYNVNGEIWLLPDSTLTIHEGVEVVFQGDYRMVVCGLLEAVGTEQDSILFKASDPSLGWSSMLFVQNSHASRLEYCSVTGAQVNFGTDATISHSSVIGNTRGPAIRINLASPAIGHCTITGSHAYNGGGIECVRSSATITHCTISGNTADAGGGGMFLFYSDIIVTHCTISDNIAAFGGGIFVQNDYGSVIDNCTISGNYSVGASGGGIRMQDDSSPIISNCLITDNYAIDGSGIYTQHYCSPIISHCTISGNSAVGSAVRIYSSSPVFQNCIIQDNTGNGGINFNDSPYSLNTSVAFCDFFNNGGPDFWGYGAIPAGLGEIVTTNSNGDPCDTYFNIFQDALFATGTDGSFYLSQTAAGQVQQSPCVDAGDPSSPMIFGWTRTDEIQDAGIVDMGYHYQPPSPPLGLITGLVAPGYSGITIDLLDRNNALLSSILSSVDGSYSFPDLAPGDYIVELVEPLGFVANQNDVPVSLAGGETVTVDFELTPTIVHNDARLKSYWRHQVNANLSGRGNVDYTASELLDFSQEIFDHFYMNVLNPIEVEGVTFVGNPAAPSTLSDLWDMLSINQNGSTMYERACQQYLALLLNVVAGKLGQYFEASDDGATVSQAIVYIEQLLGVDDELAKDIAETLNHAQTMGAGVIPLDTPNIAFRGGTEAVLHPYSFRLGGAVPNPFNAKTTIPYQLPATSDVKLEVYNLLGQRLATLVDEKQEAGYKSVVWNASEVSSGLYFYKLTAGEFTETKRMMLVK